MSWQIAGLIVVVVGFTALALWVFWPANRARFEQLGRIPLDADDQQGDAR